VEYSNRHNATHSVEKNVKILNIAVTTTNCSCIDRQTILSGAATYVQLVVKSESKGKF